MKTVELQIAEYLYRELGPSKFKDFSSAYARETFIKGVTVYLEGIEHELTKQGWYESNDIEGKEVVKVGDKTFIQEKEIQEAPYVKPEKPVVNIYCPECNEIMDIESLCDKRKDNPNKYKAVVVCRACTYHKYYFESVPEVLQNIGGKNADR